MNLQKANKENQKYIFDIEEKEKILSLLINEMSLQKRSEKILKKIDSNRVSQANSRINLKALLNQNNNNSSNKKIERSITPNLSLIHAHLMKIHSDQNKKQLGMTNREDTLSYNKRIPLKTNMNSMNKFKQNLSTEKFEILGYQNKNDLNKMPEGKPRSINRDRAYTQYWNSNYSRFSKSSKILKTIGNNYQNPKRVYI